MGSPGFVAQRIRKKRRRRRAATRSRAPGGHARASSAMGGPKKKARIAGTVRRKVFLAEQAGRDGTGHIRARARARTRMITKKAWRRRTNTDKRIYWYHRPRQSYPFSLRTHSPLAH